MEIQMVENKIKLKKKPEGLVLVDTKRHKQRQTDLWNRFEKFRNKAAEKSSDLKLDNTMVQCVKNGHLNKQLKDWGFTW